METDQIYEKGQVKAMIRGLYSAASGMIANQRRQEALTNDLANIQTPGYKRDEAVYRSFPQVLLERIRDNQNTQIEGLPNFPGQKAIIGRMSNGVYVQEYVADFSQGTLKETGNPLDLSIVDQDIPAVEQNGQMIQPKIFFAVQEGNGDVRYTRNGNFSVDPEGQLMTSSGRYVLDNNNNRINIQALLRKADGTQYPLTKEFIQIDNTGRLTTPNGQVQLQMAQVMNPNQLEKEGNDLYRLSEGQDQPQIIAPGTPTPFQVQQGFIESSNVDPSRAMVDMMNLVRQFEANQKVLSTYDSSLQKLFDVARV